METAKREWEEIVRKVTEAIAQWFLGGVEMAPTTHKALWHQEVMKFPQGSGNAIVVSEVELNKMYQWPTMCINWEECKEYSSLGMCDWLDYDDKLSKSREQPGNCDLAHVALTYIMRNCLNIFTRKCIRPANVCNSYESEVTRWTCRAIFIAFWLLSFDINFSRIFCSWPHFHHLRASLIGLVVYVVTG